MEVKNVFNVSESVNTIICDIEGTTTAISFVKDVLFPFVRNNLKSFLTENYEDHECQSDLRLLIEQSKEDFKSQGSDVPLILDDFEHKDLLIESAIKNILWQMNADRKSLALKQLQGHMWKDAYASGLIKGHVYVDVVPAFEKWKSHGMNIFIYSSGSIEAQKLLFGFSEKGDLLHYFSGHFDTNIGLKVNAESYTQILQSIGKTGDQVLFLTDYIREAEASTKAGMHVCVLRRADNPDKEIKSFAWVSTFDDLVI